LNFRHLLEEHELCGQMLDTVNLDLASKGIRITTGTIVDATIIHAPSSTKNEHKERDPEMHLNAEARVRLHQGALSRFEEEPRVTMCGICPGNIYQHRKRINFRTAPVEV
jgi:IS5 family transposase